MTTSRAYVRVHLDGSEVCEFHLTGQGPATFATIEVVGTDVALYAVAVEQLDQLVDVITRARSALAERQSAAESPVSA